jgi:hypothetical protein
MDCFAALAMTDSCHCERSEAIHNNAGLESLRSNSWLRACIQTQRASIFQKFCATFLQKFAAVSSILQKILQKNEPKFVEKRGVMGLKTGSSLQSKLQMVIFRFEKKHRLECHRVETSNHLF